MTAPPMALPAGPATGWFSPEDCRLEDFRALVEQATRPVDYPYADAVQDNVLIYGERMRGYLDAAGGPDGAAIRRDVQAELARALGQGPGIVVFKRAFGADVVDRATGVFAALIAEQKASGAASGDHFAKPGTNDRIWGALDKFALRAPEVFADYYANDVLALICEAWLGPNYQMTSQPNVVNPGGQAQLVHRDYHLGFMDREQALAYPVQAHLLSPAQALQNLITVAAEGYPFPTNLDRDQPIGGMTPQTQAELLSQAVAEDWEPGRLDVELAAQQQRRIVGAA